MSQFFPMIEILHLSQSLLKIVLSVADPTANGPGVFNCIRLDLVFPTPRIFLAGWDEIGA